MVCCHFTRVGGRRRAAARVVVLVAIVVIVMALIAWWRVGLLDLPSVPSGISAAQAGLSDLETLRALDEYLRPRPQDASNNPPRAGPAPSPAASKVRSGIEAVASGDVERGLVLMREGVQEDPDNLVLANAYRMQLFALRRAFLHDARARGEIAPTFPAYLEKEPIGFFRDLAQAHPSRETKLQLALAWVDEMLLFPALEMKAPASVEAVNILTDLLHGDDASYVPALFARGLNHLHRPARLVWPETNKTPKDAAAQDIGRCVAIGRRLGLGSDRLHAVMCMTLGDAYVKAGRYNLARSWWQIAQNTSSDPGLQDSIHRRYGWNDEEMLDRLEEELDRARAKLAEPMTDLRLMWR